MADRGGLVTRTHLLHYRDNGSGEDDSGGVGCYGDATWYVPESGERSVTCGCGMKWVVSVERPREVTFVVRKGRQT